FIGESQRVDAGKSLRHGWSDPCPDPGLQIAAVRAQVDVGKASYGCKSPVILRVSLDDRCHIFQFSSLKAKHVIAISKIGIERVCGFVRDFGLKYSCGKNINQIDVGGELIMFL